MQQATTGVFSRKSKTTTKKVCVFLDDDGRSEAFTIFKPIADEKNFKFTFALLPKFVSDGVADYMTWAQIKQLQSEGHDFASHSVQHLKLDTLTLDVAEAELRDSKQLLKDQGIYVDHFVYPGGGYNRDVANLARKYYKSAVSIDYGINVPPIEQYTVPRVQADSNTLAYLKTRVDQLNAMTSGMIVFEMHSFFPDWTAAKQQDLRDLVDYIRSLNIEIMTYSQAFDYFGNVVDIGSKA
jgi:peptidoglycan/xylan/chitin deacetylase (PgdA/CDA1 family)